jgi:DNA polymerase III epsilon subunit-like protein
MRFVALDLETTWLSPETDTIIEVAAVAFELEIDVHWRYSAISREERSMLIYPGREMTEEISMITGITDAMLSGKSVWWDVCERVREFIGDESVIVGHNVLFDVAMLRTHDIDLSQHPILDTFELSEIFSQDVESLNLGYLSGLYGISAWDKEHRALGDTRLSVGLLIHYLNTATWLDESKKHVLMVAGQCEKQKNLWLLCDILWWQYDSSIIWIFLWVFSRQQGDDNQTILPSENSHQRISKREKEDSISIHNIPIGYNEERDFLCKHLNKEESIHIGVFGYIQAAYMVDLLTELSYQAEVYHEPREYISMDELHARIVRGNWSRKESVLITKLLYWSQNTNTGLLKELKLYGEERDQIVFYQMQEGENNFYYTQLRKKLQLADIVVYDIYKQATYLSAMQEKNTTLIIKDIPLLEEAVRRNNSLHISIEKIVGFLQEFANTEKLTEIIRFIEALYLSLPVRPTWPEVSPPGWHGETYFLPQDEVWQRGWVTLSLITRSLRASYSEWCDTRIIWTRRDRYVSGILDISIWAILDFHTRWMSIWVIMTIQMNCLTLSLIPRDVQKDIHTLLISQRKTICYGSGIAGPKIQEFISTESGINTKQIEIIEKSTQKKLKIQWNALAQKVASWLLGGTIILTTSAKNTREIWKSLEKTWFKILIQWISGGKGKQLGIFKNNPEKTVLIGTIDMWREEIELWNHAKNIIITKLPFDPPTDSYFLARTVGMRNNFSRYSEPMLIIKINTLLSRIYSSQYTWSVFCEDMRLTETIWGKELIGEIL